MSKLVLVRGIPGSGKSTIAGILSHVGFIHIESDQFFMHRGKYVFDISKQSLAHAWCVKETRDLISLGNDVVVSNTFTRLWEMAPYVDIAAEWVVPLTIIEAKGTYVNTHGVPPDVLKKMCERWEDVEEMTYSVRDLGKLRT